MNTGPRILLGTASLVVSLAGCASMAAYPSGLDGASGTTLQALQAQELYPANFRMLHRVVLTIGGRELAFSGYVLVDRSRAARVVAFSEMGGTLFDVLVAPPAEPRVIRCAPGFKPAWIGPGAGALVQILYLAPPLPTARTAPDWTIEVRAWARLEGWDTEVPVSLLAKNLAKGYTVEITVLQMTLGGADASKMTVEPAS